MEFNAKMRFVANLVVFALLSVIVHLGVDACRVGSEGLKSYTKNSVEQLLDASILESIYWPDEPLDSKVLSKALGFNFTSVETKFDLGDTNEQTKHNGSEVKVGSIEDVTILKDIFVACSTDRDRSYSLTINLELDNPFKNIIFAHYGVQGENLKFRIRLPDSTFLVQLKQRIRYDECLDVVYVQLAPNISYELECIDCSPQQQANLDKSFSKRMNQFDSELNPLLSEKLLLGLQILLSQQRLDLDLYLNAQD